MILETERLYLREMNQNDFESLCKILQDKDTIYAYEGAFSDDEAHEWLDRQLTVIKNGVLVYGQLFWRQPWKDSEVLEIGYLFERSYWHNGYATEAAKACKKYAFEVLNATEVCSIIRDTNIASQNVSVRNGMKIMDTWIKHYRCVDIPHYRYVIYR